METTLSQNDMMSLIQVTLGDTVARLSQEIETLRALNPATMPEQSLSELVDETRKFVVFLRYTNEYMKKTTPFPPLKEEMLRHKLHLLSVLRALADHVKAQDRVAVYDLITEELRDNLTMWKINVLPLMRRQAHLATGSMQA